MKFSKSLIAVTVFLLFSAQTAIAAELYLQDVDVEVKNDRIDLAGNVYLACINCPGLQIEGGPTSFRLKGSKGSSGDLKFGYTVPAQGGGICHFQVLLSIIKDEKNFKMSIKPGRADAFMTIGAGANGCFPEKGNYNYKLSIPISSCPYTATDCRIKLEIHP